LVLYIANYRTTTLRDQTRTNLRINIVDGKQAVTLVIGLLIRASVWTGRITFSERCGIIESGEADTLDLIDAKVRGWLVCYSHWCYRHSPSTDAQYTSLEPGRRHLC